MDSISIVSPSPTTSIISLGQEVIDAFHDMKFKEGLSESKKNRYRTYVTTLTETIPVLLARVKKTFPEVTYVSASKIWLAPIMIDPSITSQDNFKVNCASNHHLCMLGRKEWESCVALYCIVKCATKDEYESSYKVLSSEDFLVKCHDHLFPDITSILLLENQQQTAKQKCNALLSLLGLILRISFERDPYTFMSNRHTIFDIVCYFAINVNKH